MLFNKPEMKFSTTTATTISLKKPQFGKIVQLQVTKI